jgi:hypothetical protein
VYEHRSEIKTLIERFQIPLTMIAGAAEVRVARVSDFVRGVHLSPAVEDKIKLTVTKIADVYDTFWPFRIILDTPELLDKAVSSARVTLLNRATGEVDRQVAHAELRQALSVL